MRKFVLLVLVAIAAQSAAAKSIEDSIPFISQLKSAFQAIGRDVEGARQTQENSIQTSPVGIAATMFTGQPLPLPKPESQINLDDIPGMFVMRIGPNGTIICG